MDASIERISDVNPHPDADRLDLVQVLGFQCITQRGLYKKGDIVCYIRPDTVLPEEEWAEGYRQYAPKRVKAVKLRGLFSEGIIVQTDLIKHKFKGEKNLVEAPDFWESLINFDEINIAEILGVKHYEEPAPKDNSAKGGLPYQIPKTDEERWENIIHKIPFGEKVDVTLKIDGQSWTAFYNLEDDNFGITGRNLEFKDTANNNYTQNALKYNIKNKLKEYCIKNNVSLAIRGESYGKGIQGLKLNPHSKENLNLAIFSVYNITERKYERKNSKFYFKNVAKDLEIPHVPILLENETLTENLINYFSKDIKKLPSGQYFEGVVIQTESRSFKIINKHYDSNK